MSGKVIVTAVSIILVVGVCIGAVVVVRNKGGEGGISTQQKSVKIMCEKAEEQELCYQTLGSAKDTSDPKALLATTVEAATQSVIRALNMSDKLIVEHGDKNQGIKMALDDCKDLLQSAMDSLEASSDLLTKGNMQEINDRSPDFKNWLAAVISYQHACMDSYDDKNDGEKEVKEKLQTEGLDSMGKLTGIGLDIMADLSNILQQFGLKLDVLTGGGAGSRRLMEVDEEGYPTWFSKKDRKLLARGHHVRPNVVVSKDGRGQFKTITDAIKSHPGKNLRGRYIISIRAGVYDEYIIVPKEAVNLMLIGEGAGKTIITGHKNFVDGVKTMDTATFANTAPGFIAKYLTFENSAGPQKHQAVAFRNQGDMSAVFSCAIVGYQDTLYAQTNRQFYRNCDISGTVDFIFGMSSTIIQNSRIIVRKPLDNQFNTVTADGTVKNTMPTGIVIQNCDIIPENALFPVRFAIKSYLGRPWKECSRTVVMESRIGDLIQPVGWAPWDGNLYLNTLYYAEYNNAGPGSNVAGRVRWPGYKGLISRDQAARFTVGQFLKGGDNSRAELWMKPLHVPFDLGFTKP